MMNKIRALKTATREVLVPMVVACAILTVVVLAIFALAFFFGPLTAYAIVMGLLCVGVLGYMFYNSYQDALLFPDEDR